MPLRPAWASATLVRARTTSDSGLGLLEPGSTRVDAFVGLEVFGRHRGRRSPGAMRLRAALRVRRHLINPRDEGSRGSNPGASALSICRDFSSEEGAHTADPADELERLVAERPGQPENKRNRQRDRAGRPGSRRKSSKKSERSATQANAWDRSHAR